MTITEANCFYPDSNLYFDPAGMGYAREDLWVDGSLHAWFIRPKEEHAGTATVVNLHGNAENMTSHILASLFFLEMGHRLVTFDYRGYGRSKGSPTLQGIQDDARAVFTFVFNEPRRFGESVFGFGQSMGGFTLARILPDIPALKGAIMDSALYSFRDLFQDAYPGVPCTVPPISALETLPLSGVPKLFIHGTADVVVPYAHSRKMFAVASEPKDIMILEGVEHIGALGSPLMADYVAKIGAFVETWNA
ncbi:MAG: alpha/beta hydrolase [Syntrophaceae bacterium]